MNTRIYCPECDAEREFEIREEKESYPVKNENVEIIAQVTYCKSCGEQIWNEEIDEENLRKAYRQYRASHGLLQPEEIKRIRLKYNLTQTTFAKILGFGDKTIARYENGRIQDNAQNNLIELADYPDVFEKLLKKCEGVIADADYQHATEALKKLRPSIITGEKTITYRTGQHPYKFNKYFGGFNNVI